jgi:RNA polymerase sigma-70 factor (ECF subfamily)
VADTAVPGKWAPAHRPVRPLAGVHAEKLEQDGSAARCGKRVGDGGAGDSRPDGKGAGRGAFGAYLRAATGIRHGTGLYVLTLTGDRICAMTRFDNSVFPWFGLPRSLPGR